MNKPVNCGCGGEAKVISYLSREYCMMAYYVRCIECGTETDDFISEAEAITAWNRAMGERTAKVKDFGHPCGAYEYCSNCNGYCVNEEPYCPHCGARLEWK